MKKSRLILVLMVVYGIFLNLSPLIWTDTQMNPTTSPAGNLLSIVLYLMLFMGGVYFKLEEADLSTKEVVLIAIYSTFVGVSRIPFAAIPSVQPCSYLIFAAGWVFGPLIGFAVGMNTVLISNIFLGHGPWSINQMFIWGMFGFLGGVMNLSQTKHPNRKVNAAIGFIFGFIYGWFLNLWFFVMYVPDHSWKGFMLANASSFYFDLSHAIGNALFFWYFGNRTIGILERFRQRFLIQIEFLQPPLVMETEPTIK